MYPKTFNEQFAAVIAAIYPSLTVAPITPVIVLLVPEMTHTSAMLRH